MNRQVWIMEDSEHQGDYSDAASHNTYQVGNITDAVGAEATALAEGAEPIWFDASADTSLTYDVEAGQNFSIGHFEGDSQGVLYQPRGNDDA